MKTSTVIVAIAALILLTLIQHLDPFYSRLISFSLILGIAALGVNLLFGYGGLASFGHAAYVATGAYTTILISRATGITSVEILFPSSVALVALFSLLVGLLCSRHTKMYFALLTLAVGQIMWAFLLKYDPITGGDDGLRLVHELSLFGQTFGRLDYYFILSLFCLSVVVMWYIVNSPFGKTLQAMRDNEQRAEFIGISVWKYRTLAFTISGIYCGLAGCLYAQFEKYVHPTLSHFPFSGELIAMAVLGGAFILVGPLAGALVFKIIKTLVSARFFYWPMVFGIIIIACVLLFPEGIVGRGMVWAKKIREKIKIF